ncbi:MAG: cardiolipin synthase [Gemmataceae bacterium]
MADWLLEHVTHLTLFALLDTVLILVVIPIVLVKKRDSTVAVGWCLVVLLMPVLGALLFWVFGYNYVNRRVTRKRRHRSRFDQSNPPTRPEARRGPLQLEQATELTDDPARLAVRLDAFPLSTDNAVTLYHHTDAAYEALLDAIAQAKSHVHLQFYIFRDDAAGRRIVDVLVERARAGVEVRLLYDSVGSFFLSSKLVRRVVEAGGKARDSLPVNLLRSWIQVNLRNHRKIVVIDGRVAFTGGMNIGDEYLGRSAFFGYWRDTFLRVEGPAVAGLQRIFAEDWHFSAGESLNGEAYFPEVPGRGKHAVQVVEGGPDQPVNSIREIYFAAIVEAKWRLWIASPYFVPDSGLLDALRLARLRGVDVRLLCLLRPDHFLSFYASRYYWGDLLSYGGRVYQYGRGMMHAKVVLVDDRWAMVGSANLDNRSLRTELRGPTAAVLP